MEELRRWLASVLEGVFNWLTSLLSAMVRGLTHEWNITYFVLGMVILLMAGLVTVWYRGGR